MSSLFRELTPEQLSSTPVWPPPNGTQSNFGDAENNNTPLYVVCSLFLAVMLCFYINRIYTKIYILRRYSWDDVTITVALLGSIFLFVASIWGGKRGRVGCHYWDISLAQASSKDIIIPTWILACFTPVVYLFLKDSFFILYLSAFEPLRWLRICAYTGAAITTGFYISMTVAALIFTTPRRGESWPERLSSKDEQRSLALPVPVSIFGVIIDLIILLLPIIAVIPLQLPLRRKIGVICVFTTGLLACVFSMLGIYFRKIDQESKDNSWDTTAVYIVTLLEIFLGIICACTPAAAKSTNHHLKHLSALKSIVISQLSKAGSRTKQSQNSLSSRQSDDQAEQYSNYTIYQGPSRGTHNLIHNGIPHDLENDGIRLTFEIQNQRSQVRYPAYEMPTLLERLDSHHDSAISRIYTHQQSEQV